MRTFSPFAIFGLVLVLIAGVVIAAARSHDEEPGKYPPQKVDAEISPPVLLEIGEEIARVTLPDTVHSVSVSPDGLQVLALIEDALLELDPRTLATKKTIPIKAGDDTASPYWWGYKTPIVVSADHTHVLVFDRFIEIETGLTETIIDVASAVQNGGPNPKPLDISPNGKLALYLVYSYSAGQHNALAVFNLETGKLLHTRDTGETIRNAAFASDSRILSVHSSNRVTIDSLDGQDVVSVTKSGIGSTPSGSRVSATGSNDNRIVCMEGVDRHQNQRFIAIDVATNDVLYNKKINGFIGYTQPNEHWALYQTVRPSKTICPCGKHHLEDVILVAHAFRSGQTIETRMHVAFDSINWHPGLKALLGVDGDTIHLKSLPADWIDQFEQLNAQSKSQANTAGP